MKKIDEIIESIVTDESDLSAYDAKKELLTTILAALPPEIPIKEIGLYKGDSWNDCIDEVRRRLKELFT